MTYTGELVVETKANDIRWQAFCRVLFEIVDQQRAAKAEEKPEAEQQPTA